MLVLVLLEILRLAASTWLHLPIPLWLLIPLLLGLALLAVRWTDLTFSQIGLRRWRDWTATERSYFVQVLVIANVVFPVVLATPLRQRAAQSDFAWTLWSVFMPYLFYGFYQELVYRGMIQLELVRRFGTVTGILAANVFYTFGPLHAYYFASRASLAVPMFASIFAIGVLFGVLFRRSGNLWIVAVMHAIGNAYMVGTLKT